MNAEAQTQGTGGGTTTPKRQSKNRKPVNAERSKPSEGAALVNNPKKGGLSPADSARLDILAQNIREASESINSMVMSVKEKLAAYLDKAIECGKMLEECKHLLPHGSWQKWMKANCSISFDRAQDYMRIARSDLAKTAHAPFLEEPKSVRQAILMLTDSKGANGAKKNRASASSADEDYVTNIAAMSSKLMEVLNKLTLQQKVRAFEALDEVHGWLKDAAIDV